MRITPTPGTNNDDHEEYGDTRIRNYSMAQFLDPMAYLCSRVTRMTYVLEAYRSLNCTFDSLSSYLPGRRPRSNFAVPKRRHWLHSTVTEKSGTGNDDHEEYGDKQIRNYRVEGSSSLHMPPGDQYPIG